MPGVTEHDIVAAELDFRPVKHLNQKPMGDHSGIYGIVTMHDARTDNVNDMWVN